MSVEEVKLKTIAECQAAIKKLDPKKDAEKIKELQAKISEALAGTDKVDTGSGEVNISTAMGYNKVKGKSDIDAAKEMTDKSKVREEFGNGYDESVYENAKAELKKANKAVKALNKQLSKLKYDTKDGGKAYNTERNSINAKLETAKAEASKWQAVVDAQENYKRGATSSKFARKTAKANKQNAKQYEKTLDVEYVFVSKDQAKAFEEKNPDAKGHTKVINNNDLIILEKLYNNAVDEIEKAKQTGDSEKIKAAEAKYGDAANIFMKTEDGETDFTAINTRAAQNVLAGKSGADQRFNIDEKAALAEDLDVKKGQIAHLAKKLGFGNESVTAQKLKAAGITAAATALGSLVVKSHDHHTAEASATAQGETVQGEVSWLASNGEEFYHYFEAKGGNSAVSVVAEACAKVPLIGQLAGPVLAGVTAFFLTKGSTQDVFGGKNVDAILDNLKPASKDAKPVLQQIKDMEITGDPAMDKNIKAAVLKAAIGEDTKACNLRELSAAYLELKKTKDAIGKIQLAEQNDDNNVDPNLNNGGDEVNSNNGGNGKSTVDPNDNVTTQPTSIKAKAIDYELLKKRGVTETEENASGKGKAQMNMGMQASITGDAEAPDTIKITDNTNKKDNTYEYRKLTDAEIAAGKTSDGRAIKIPDDIKNAGKPIYILEKAYDDKGNLKTNHEEVYQLELQKSEDGKEYNYRLNQYEGMSGSGESSMDWGKRATRTPSGRGGADDRPKIPRSTGAMVITSGGKKVVLLPTDQDGVYKDSINRECWKRGADGKLRKVVDRTDPAYRARVTTGDKARIVRISGDRVLVLETTKEGIFKDPITGEYWKIESGRAPVRATEADLR